MVKYMANPIKGAIIGLDPSNPVSSIIVFQYNPDTMTRTLQPQTASMGGGTYETQRLKGAPIESIRLEIDLDANEQLEQGEADELKKGIYPQLSALEMLVYPKSQLVIANTILMELGIIEVSPPMGPLTLFVWGWKRVVPVRITELSITEEAYDSNLNPIRAKVSLGMQILSYNDVSWTHPAYTVFLAHQVIKEVMATMGSIENAGRLGEVVGVS